MASENGMPEGEDVKKKALLRLAVAGLVTVAALAGLWWLDHSKSEKSRPVVEAPVPAPILAAPEANPAPPPAEPAPVSDTGAPAPAGPAREEAPLSEPVPAGEAPPPPRVSNHYGMPPAPSQPVQKPTLASPNPAPALDGASFAVQLGVFSDPAHAQEMVDTLNKKGIHARMEIRVQVGPFLNRQEAEKAQAELRKLGLNGLVAPAAAMR